MVRDSTVYQHQYYFYNITETDRVGQPKKTCYQDTFVRGKLPYVLHIVVASYR